MLLLLFSKILFTKKKSEIQLCKIKNISYNNIKINLCLLKTKGLSEQKISTNLSKATAYQILGKQQKQKIELR